MYCLRCGATQSKEDSYCGSCGSRASVSAATQHVIETAVRVYQGADAYQSELVELSGKGWSPLNVTERKPRAGLLKIFTLGFFALVFPPKPELVVTYQRRRLPGTKAAPLSSNYAPEAERSWLRTVVMVGVMFN